MPLTSRRENRAATAVPTSRKPSWNSSTNDLSQYKLSKEDLEERRRARQHKPLAEYRGPPLVRRKQREDGTWYVTGARPTSAMAMLAATVDGAPSFRRRRGRIPRSASADPGDSRGRSRSRSESSDRSIHIQTNHLSDHKEEDSGDVAQRMQGSVFTTTASGALLESSGLGVSYASHVEDQPCDGANNSLNAEWDNLVLSHDSGSPSVAAEQDLDEIHQSSPSDRRLQGRARHQSTGSEGLKESTIDVKSGQQHTLKTKQVLVAATARVANGDGMKSQNRLKSGPRRVDSNSPLSGQRPASRPSIVAEVMADLRAHRDQAERDKAMELDHLATACEVLRTRIVKYEFDSGRHLLQPPPEPLERNPDKPGCYTDFLLKASARLYEYLGESEKNNEILSSDLQKVRKSVDTANQEIAQLRAGMETMKQEIEKQQHCLQLQFDSKVTKLEEEHQALAEQTASLFHSYEYDGVNSLLNNILGAPPRKPSGALQHISPGEVSPDRWSSASTIDGQRNSCSPPDSFQATNAPNLAHGGRSALHVSTRCSTVPKTASVAEPGCVSVVHDPLASTGRPLGIKSPDVDEYDVDNEVHPLSPLSPQYSPPLPQHQQELDDSEEVSLNESQEERDDGDWDVARVAVPQPTGRVTNHRVEMLKTQHMLGPLPLSPVHESPLEV